MNNKFFYLYLIGGTLMLLLLIYQLISPHPNGFNLWNLGGDILPMIILFYLAFKTYHEKKDKEMM